MLEGRNDLSADRQDEDIPGTPDADEAHQDATKAPATLQPALAGKGRGNQGSGRTSFRARFADDVPEDDDFGDDKSVGQDAGGGQCQSGAVEQTVQSAQETGAMESGEREDRGGVLGETPGTPAGENPNAATAPPTVRNETGAQPYVAVEGPVPPVSTASPPEPGNVTGIISNEPLASPPAVPGLDRSAEPPAVRVLDQGVVQPASGSGHGAGSVAASAIGSAASQPVSETGLEGDQYIGQEAMPTFMYDEISGMLFDEQGYAYDQEGNLRGYLDGTGTFQAYTQDELQYYAAALNGNQPQEPE